MTSAFGFSSILIFHRMQRHSLRPFAMSEKLFLTCEFFTPFHALFRIALTGCPSTFLSRYRWQKRVKTIRRNSTDAVVSLTQKGCSPDSFMVPDASASRVVYPLLCIGHGGFVSHVSRSASVNGQTYPREKEGDYVYSKIRCTKGSSRILSS
jgi:hypothetical protein